MHHPNTTSKKRHLLLLLLEITTASVRLIAATFSQEEVEQNEFGNYSAT